jgi:hypothetical protein
MNTLGIKRTCYEPIGTYHNIMSKVGWSLVGIKKKKEKKNPHLP